MFDHLMGSLYLQNALIGASNSRISLLFSDFYPFNFLVMFPFCFYQTYRGFCSAIFTYYHSLLSLASISAIGRRMSLMVLSYINSIMLLCTQTPNIQSIVQGKQSILIVNKNKNTKRVLVCLGLMW